MKYSLIALAATTICGASAAAHNHHRRHNHAALYKRYQTGTEACGCTTYVTTRVVPVTGKIIPFPLVAVRAGLLISAHSLPRAHHHRLGLRAHLRG